jgi:hypothetical protein
MVSKYRACICKDGCDGYFLTKMTLYITRSILFQGGKRMYKAAVIPTNCTMFRDTIAENTQMPKEKAFNIETPISKCT